METYPEYQTFETFTDGNVRVLVVKLRQVMDDAADRLRREFVQAATDDGPKRLVLSLERVSYVSSAGIGALVALLKRVREADGRLILCGLSTQTEQVLRLCRLIGDVPEASAFHTAPDVAAATARLREG
jgi:anti-sigma B factor antagonist